MAISQEQNDSIPSDVRYVVFENCWQQGLEGDDLTAEYHRQLRLLAIPAVGSTCTATAIISTSELLAGPHGPSSTQHRTIVGLDQRS